MAMAAFFSLTLIISITGLVSLLMLKHYELTSGRRIALGGLRIRLERFFHSALMVIERGIPGLVGKVATVVVRLFRSRIQRILARAILLFENYLERTLHIVRQKSQPPRGEGAASEFLQEVAAHKQKLLRRAPSKRAIFDDQ